MKKLIKERTIRRKEKAMIEEKRKKERTNQVGKLQKKTEEINKKLREMRKGVRNEERK